MRDKSPILRGGLAHYRLDKSLRPPLKSGDLSSQILESQSEIRKQLDPTASDSTLESTFTQSPDSISKILPRETMGEKKADSSNDYSASAECIDCHADKSARNDNKNADSKKADSSKSKPQADPLSSRADTAQFPSSRASETSVAIHSLESIFSKVDSSHTNLVPYHSSEVSHQVDSMDCHALHSKARNDRKTQNLNDSAQDSRSFNKNAQNVFCSQVDRRQDFCDKNGALQGESKARTWACVTADSPQQSPFLAKKPTPEPSKAQSSSQKPTPQTPPVLVSLTSFPARLPYLHHTLYSILTQDYKDFHIALFLSSSEIAPSKLPLILKIFQKLGLLSIHFVEENLRAYKKLFYALQAYPEHIIITIDDDQIYAPNTIRLLLESYARFPRAIHTHLAYDGAYMADILQVDCARYCAIIKESSPHLALASVGVSGVLYPPRAFSQEFFNTQAILSLAPYSDDLWFFVMSVLNDVPKVLIQGALEHPKESSIAIDESPNLWEINCCLLYTSDAADD